MSILTSRPVTFVVFALGWRRCRRLRSIPHRLAGTRLLSLPPCLGWWAVRAGSYARHRFFPSDPGFRSAFASLPIHPPVVHILTPLAFTTHICRQSLLQTPGAFPYPMGRGGPMGWNGPDCCPCPPPASPAKWISPHDEGPFGTGRQGFLEVASKNPTSLELWKANSKMMHNMLEEREAKLRK